MTQIRIVILGPLPPPASGPELMMEALLKRLVDYPGVKFVHLNTQVSRSLGDKGKRRFQKMFLGLRHALRFLKILMVFRPNAVYLTLTNSVGFDGFMRDALFILSTRWFSCKMIVHLRGGYCRYVRHTGWKRPIVGYVLGQASLALVQGERLINVFDGLISPERIAVLTNGINDRPFVDAMTRNIREPRGTQKVLYAGLLCAEKGVFDILRAIPYLNVSPVRFVFLGEWASQLEKERAFSIVKNLGIQTQVDFPGVVTGAAKYDQFASAEVFVFPSYYQVEGHAVVSVEALAAGLPIICTNHGALGESVIDNWNGFFVPSHNPVALASRLDQLLSDNDLRRLMGQRSRNAYEQRFTLDKFVDRWLELVQNCIRASV